MTLFCKERVFIILPQKGQDIFSLYHKKLCPSSHQLLRPRECCRSLSVSQKRVWFPSEAAADSWEAGGRLRYLHCLHLPTMLYTEPMGHCHTLPLDFVALPDEEQKQRVNWRAKGFVQEKGRNSDVAALPAFLCKRKLWLELEDNSKVLHYKGNSPRRINSLSPAVSYQLL